MNNRKMFSTAAALVRSILSGDWTNEPPSWTDKHRYAMWTDVDHDEWSFTRAVQTAEAFILLFCQMPGFDQDEFLVECGLVEKGER